jgi:hypothetical protein
MAIELRVARGEDRAAIWDVFREARRAALSYLPGLRSDEEREPDARMDWPGRSPDRGQTGLRGSCA